MFGAALAWKARLLLTHGRKVGVLPGLPGAERAFGCGQLAWSVEMPSRRLRLIVLVGLLAVAEVVILSLYMREVGRLADALVGLEYARGAAAIATARAARCSRIGMP